MTVAAFISSCRADYAVPVTVCCRALGVSASWYYKWRDRPPTARQDRRAELAYAVWESFKDSGFVYGSPRVWLALVEAGAAPSAQAKSLSSTGTSLVRQRSRPRSSGATAPAKSP